MGYELCERNRQVSPLLHYCQIEANFDSACVLGAGIICVDIVVERFFGIKSFRIADSNGFLSGSLSLSAGVMVKPSSHYISPI